MTKMLQPILLALLCAVCAASSLVIAFLIVRGRALRAALDAASGALGEVPRAPASRVALPMSSGVNVPIGASAQITSRPYSASFSPDQIIIESPEEWAIDGVTIDGESQLKDGPVRADALGPRIPWGVVGSGKALSMTVTYLGEREDGAPFRCAILGIPFDLSGPIDPRLFTSPPGEGSGTGAEAEAGT